jgi:hypothetical protein
MLIKASPRGPMKRVAYAMVHTQATAARQRVRVQATTERQGLFAAAAATTWNEWLCARASTGDLDALAVLRARTDRAAQLRGDLFAAARASAAKAIIWAALMPKVRKDGTVAYRTVDGGLVLDRTSHVQAAQATAGAALLALSLAADRFQGQALDVRGTDQFRLDVAQLAGVHQVSVRFTDPALEALRQAALPVAGVVLSSMAPPMPTPAATSAAAEPALSAVQAWITQRNIARNKIQSIPYNRLWTPADAGRVIYRGRRRMEDGSEVLLLEQQQGDLLVMPAGPRVMAKASTWPIGRAVRVDARGRFVERSQEYER